MAMRHRDLPLEGVQFHPESVLTEGGHRLLANWLAGMRRRRCGRRAEALAPVVRAGVPGRAMTEPSGVGRVSGRTATVGVGGSVGGRGRRSAP